MNKFILYSLIALTIIGIFSGGLGLLSSLGWVYMGLGSITDQASEEHARSLVIDQTLGIMQLAYFTLSGPVLLVIYYLTVIRKGSLKTKPR